MNKKRLHKLASILREAAPGPIHDRLEGKLGDWAAERGFIRELHKSLPQRGRPDVYRLDESRRFLFIGDAKDSENEDAFTFKTYERISGYLECFADFIGDGAIHGGMFAIATDSHEEADDWAGRLSLFAFDLGLTDHHDGSPEFQVSQIDEGTWIAWW